RTATHRSRRSCAARDRARRIVPRAPAPRSPGAGALVLAVCDQAVHHGLQPIRRRLSLERRALDVDLGRGVYSERDAFLQALVNAAGVSLAVHTGIVALDVEPDRLGELAKQPGRILPLLCPLVIEEQLIVHLPKLPLLPRALGGERRGFGVLVPRQGKVAKTPLHLAGR